MLALCCTVLPQHHQHRQAFNTACASSWATTTSEEKRQSVRLVITAPASVTPQACIYNRLSIDGDDEK